MNTAIPCELVIYTVVNNKRNEELNSKWGISEKGVQKKRMHTANVAGASRRYFPCILYFALCHIVFLTQLINILIYIHGTRGGVVVKTLRYKPQVAGSIPDGVIGIFQ